jgi:plasmid stabilization system protein ParE
VKVEVSDEAAAQARDIDAWWRENRPAAPELFTDELEWALRALGDTPSLGVTYKAGAMAVRRLLLRRTHYHVYFEQESERIYVVAIWSAYRGRGPRV